MNDRIISLHEHFKKQLAQVHSSKDVEELRTQYLGKKGSLQELMLALRESPSEERPALGKRINDLKQEITACIDQAIEGFIQAESALRLSHETQDISLPGRKGFAGHMHPLSSMMQELLDIFINMGFSVQYGPDIDSDYYNYEGLNFPPDHPARDMQDTFYLSEKYLLRSHTSNTQLRVMQSHRPPIRIVAPGTVFRSENISARSHVFFHQIEGLYIDKHVTFSDLLATMNEFLSKLFGQVVETRFRPSFFPFVEPGLEVDIRCSSCQGAGCALCKQTGWLEVLGAGLVHPEVLKNGGINPEEYSGYAWGLGIERLVMLRYGIKDIRLFAENDVRFLANF